MADSEKQKFFVPWFTVLLGVAAIGGVIAGNILYGIYETIDDDPERQETVLRMVVVSFGVAPVLLLFRWLALRPKK